MVRIRKVRVFAVAVPVALLAIAGSAIADPVLAEAMGLDVWHVGQLERDLRENQRTESKLDRELQVITDRAGIHDLILDDLISGRLKLAEAARLKWEMNRDRKLMVDHLNRFRIGSSMEARMAHDLIVLANYRVESESRVEIRTRLINQYRKAFGIALPET